LIKGLSHIPRLKKKKQTLQKHEGKVKLMQEDDEDVYIYFKNPEV